MKRDLEDNPWFIGGIILVVALFLGAMGYAFHQSDLRIEERNKAYQKELAARPIRDMKNGFVMVDEMNCHPVLKSLTKRQKSEFTDEDMWIAKNSVECGIIFQGIRIRKDRVRAYSPHYSVNFWRNKKYDEDPGAPVHIAQLNIENCEVGLGRADEARSKWKWVVVAGECKYMDLAL